MKALRLMLVAGVIAAALALMGPALANHGSGSGQHVHGDRDTRAPQGQRVGSVQGGTLAFTGAEVTMFVVIGAVAIGAGYLMVRRARAHA